jgi:hypothetical protein
MANFVQVSTDSNIGGFPIAPRFIAVICHVVGICPCTVGESWDNFFNARRIALQCMRTEYRELDFAPTTTKRCMTSDSLNLFIPMCV